MNHRAKVNLNLEEQINHIPSNQESTKSLTRYAPQHHHPTLTLRSIPSTYPVSPIKPSSSSVSSGPLTQTRQVTAPLQRLFSKKTISDTFAPTGRGRPQTSDFVLEGGEGAAVPPSVSVQQNFPSLVHRTNYNSIQNACHSDWTSSSCCQTNSNIKPFIYPEHESTRLTVLSLYAVS